MKKLFKITSLAIALALQITSAQANSKSTNCLHNVVRVSTETVEAQEALETSIHLLNTPGLVVVESREYADGSRLALVESELTWQKKLLSTLKSLPGVTVECEKTFNPSPRITGGN